MIDHRTIRQQNDRHGCMKQTQNEKTKTKG